MEDDDNQHREHECHVPHAAADDRSWSQWSTRRTFLAGVAGTGGLYLTTIPVFAQSDRQHGSARRATKSNDQVKKKYAWQPTAHNIIASDGLRLRVWEQSQGNPTEAGLFVHGATYGGVSMFDPPIAPNWNGWMDYTASQDLAAFAVDIRGYGDSERPSEFSKSPEQSDPVVPASVAARDIRDTLDWMRKEHGFDRIHLVGLSSGTWRLRALFCHYDPDVATVTLAAGSLGQFEAPDGDQPAWTTQTKREFIRRWRAQLPESAAPDDWIGGEEYSADRVINGVWKAIYKSDQALPDRDEPTILNPTNLLQDEKHDPTAITVPTLVIRGSSDPLISREGALRLYDTVGSEDHQKTYTEIAGGTHFLFLEDRRLALYESVYNFQIS